MKLYAYGISVFFLLCSNNAFTQFISDATTGKPLYQMSDITAEGIPFLKNEWGKGIIKTSRNTVVDNLLLNYDVHSKAVVFKVNDSVYKFTDPVNELTIEYTDGSKLKLVSSPWLHNLLPGDFVEELASGKIGFYKHYKKVIVEIADYNSVRGKKVYEDKNTFFIIIDNKLREVALSKKKLQEIIGARWEEIAVYIENNKLSYKNQTGWSSAINYYNSL